MEYKIEEYKFVFDTPLKKMQERLVVSRIMKLLNDNKYDTIEHFISANSSYDTFINNFKLNNVITHFGEIISDEGYNEILASLRQLTKDKLSFSTENLKIDRFDNRKEYVTYDGVEKPIYLDDSVNDKDITRQLEDKQLENREFQTSDAERNTANMMADMEKREKESLNLQLLNDINADMLNEAEREIYDAAVTYQLNYNVTIKLDVKRGVFVNPENKMYKITNNDGVITIIDNESNTTVLDSEEKVKAPQYVKMMPYIAPDAA